MDCDLQADKTDDIFDVQISSDFVKSVSSEEAPLKTPVSVEMADSAVVNAVPIKPEEETVLSLKSSHQSIKEIEAETQSQIKIVTQTNKFPTTNLPTEKTDEIILTQVEKYTDNNITNPSSETDNISFLQDKSQRVLSSVTKNLEEEQGDISITSSGINNVTQREESQDLQEQDEADYQEEPSKQGGYGGSSRGGYEGGYNRGNYQGGYGDNSDGFDGGYAVEGGYGGGRRGDYGGSYNRGNYQGGYGDNNDGFDGGYAVEGGYGYRSRGGYGGGYNQGNYQGGYGDNSDGFDGGYAVQGGDWGSGGNQQFGTNYKNIFGGGARKGSGDGQRGQGPYRGGVDVVCERTHKIDGQVLDVKVYYDCIDQLSSQKEDRFKPPAPVEMTDIDVRKLQFLVKSKPNKEAVEKRLFNMYANPVWPKTSDLKSKGSHLKIECTLTAETKDCWKLSRNWQSKVKDSLNQYMDNLISIKHTTLQEAWPLVFEGLKSVTVKHPEAVAVILEKKDCEIYVVGLKNAVNEVSKHINDIIDKVGEELDKKHKQVQEEKTLKRHQVLILQFSKFEAHLGEKYKDITVKYDINKNCVIFEGLQGEVTPAIVEMYERLTKVAKTEEKSFSPLLQKFLQGKEVIKYVYSKMRDKQVIGVWEIVDNLIWVYSLSDSDVITAAHVLKDSVIETPVDVEQQSLQLLISMPWLQFIKEIEDENPGLVKIITQVNCLKVIILCTDKFVETTHTKVEDFLHSNTKCEKSRSLEPGSKRYQEVSQRKVSSAKKSLEEEQGDLSVKCARIGSVSQQFAVSEVSEETMFIDPMAQDLVRCDLCTGKDRKSPVEMVCKTCIVNLCSECVGKHISAELSIKHNVVGFKFRKSETPSVLCKVHSNSKCKVQCQNCSVPVCAKCLVIGNHKNHDLVEISSIIKSKKEVIMKDTEELKTVTAPTYEKMDADLEIRKKKVPENYANLKTSILKLGKEWHDEVDVIINKNLTLAEKMEKEDLDLLTDLHSDIRKCLLMVQETIRENLKLEGTEILNYQSRNEEFRRVPSTFDLSPPTFEPRPIEKEELCQKFGEIKPSTKTEVPGYTIQIPPVSSASNRSFPAQHTIVNTLPCALQATGVCCVPGAEELYISKGDTVQHLDNKGTVLREFKTKSAKINLTMNRDKKIVYSDFFDRSVNIVKNGKIENILRFHDWSPLAVCSTSTDELLVSMRIDHGSQSKIVRYDHSTVIQEIEFDAKREPLYSSPHYIVENKNLQVCASDLDTCTVVVTNEGGKLMFRYNGNLPSKKYEGFLPYGIATDSACHILVADQNNKCLHMIDQEGKFITVIENSDLNSPLDLSISLDDILFVLDRQTNIKVIKYLQ